MILIQKLLIKKKLIIEEFAVDFNKRVRNNDIDPVIGRDEEIDRIIQILCRRIKNNSLLIGEAGVGKTAIIEELSRRIEENKVPESLQNKRILSVSMASLVAGTKYRGEFEDRINKMLKEVEEDNSLILFIDEIHTIVGAGGAEGAIDASNIFKPALARGKIKIIGATTTSEYNEFIALDKALDRRFQKIEIKEPNKEKTKDILMKIKTIYESYHNTTISEEIIDYIIELSNKYIYDRNQPDKQIDILDEVCAKTSLKIDKNEKDLINISKEINNVVKAKNKAIIKQDYQEASTLKNKEKQLEIKKNNLEMKRIKKIKPKVITKKDVSEVVRLKTQIPINDSPTAKIKELKQLKNTLLENIIGQEKVIEDLYSFTKRMKLGFLKQKPYSFLLVGATGVGKTLLVKEYAKTLYNKDSFIRLDMSEYKESHLVSKIIGSPPGYVGYNDYGNVLDKIKMNPHSVILLDEIEKANPAVLKLFLQILDEGKIKNSKGETIVFDNTLIFMTSNLGVNKENIGFNNNKNKILEEIINFLSIEFVNRIDKIFYFNNIDTKAIKK